MRSHFCIRLSFSEFFVLHFLQQVCHSIPVPASLLAYFIYSSFAMAFQALYSNLFTIFTYGYQLCHSAVESLFATASLIYGDVILIFNNGFLTLINSAHFLAGLSLNGYDLILQGIDFVVAFQTLYSKLLTLFTLPYQLLHIVVIIIFARVSFIYSYVISFFNNGYQIILNFSSGTSYLTVVTFPFKIMFGIAIVITILVLITQPSIIFIGFIGLLIYFILNCGLYFYSNFSSIFSWPYYSGYFCILILFSLTINCICYLTLGMTLQQWEELKKENKRELLPPAHFEQPTIIPVQQVDSPRKVKQRRGRPRPERDSS